MPFIVARLCTYPKRIRRRCRSETECCWIDYRKMSVLVDGIDTNLTNTEYKMFSAISRVPQKTFTRAELLYYVQGYRFVGDPRIIDAHVKNIRQKIEKDPKSPQILLTVVGSGYKMGITKDEE